MNNSHISKEWQFILDNDFVSYDKIPVSGRNFCLMTDYSIDLDTVAGISGQSGDECVIYNRFTLETACTLCFGAGADWYFEAYLNGEKLYSTFKDGNRHSFFTYRNHSFFGNGRKGENLLAIRVKRGVASWEFCFKEKLSPCSAANDLITISVDAEQTNGIIKPMNAVNNGPVKARSDQSRGNMKLWQAAKIPFARNHDAAFWSGYGGEHIVDIAAIFPDFSRDANDPESYDFTLTDRYLSETLEGGTKIFYRLGHKIEHAPKKYGTKVPPDFHKWAVICEHIIRHYNEGWANGFKWNIEYWEIWNEPDLSSGREDKKTWQGTDEEFFKFFRTAMFHLKKCFPKLKIGGPALCGNLEWMKLFLTAMTSGERVPLDFFSWHSYTSEAYVVAGKAFKVRQILDSFEYKQTESCLNEWNYVRNWTDKYVESIKTIITLKGAIFTASVMCACQNAPVDMLMYYDARPCVFNGLFDFYTYAPLKGYYPFLIWSKLAEFGNATTINISDDENFFGTGAVSQGKIRMLLCRYFESDNLPDPVKVSLKINGISSAEIKIYVLDEKHDLGEIPYDTAEGGHIIFSMAPNTLVYVES